MYPTMFDVKMRMFAHIYLEKGMEKIVYGLVSICMRPPKRGLSSSTTDLRNINTLIHNRKIDRWIDTQRHALS